MDQVDYKKICSQPISFRRSVLRDTAMALADSEPEIASRIEQILLKDPIATPVQHIGNSHDDFFQIGFDEETTEKIADVLLECEAVSVSAEGTTTPQASKYGSLLDLWTNYLHSIKSEG